MDYRHPPERRLPSLPITDAHIHLRGGLEALRRFFRVADLYGINRFCSMTFLEQIDEIRRTWPGRVDFIAIPDYRQFKRTRRFLNRWRHDVIEFARRGARICKLWAAPRAREQWDFTIDLPWLRPVIDAAVDAGMGFMVHVADPDAWFATRYANADIYGTKERNYDQLHWFADYVSPRPVIGAHFIGHSENLDHLDMLLNGHRNLMLDTSATKWIAREISRHRPERARQFFSRHRGRILFGSDLVIDPKYDFTHYASRYWVQQMLWESAFRGDSPIEDPDAGTADGRVRLRGVKLGDDVLREIYFANYQRLIGGLEAGLFG
ncbi:MAG: hypothetical protein BIFFINMI_01659 [Phycisphaerae bacterium]|nr:hypothetical protein [Phycisphaerae bacterium]